MGSYDKWRLPDLLAMLNHDSRQATTAHELAWNNKLQLLQQQRQRLHMLIGELSRHWDPEISVAAKVFISNLSEMVRQIDNATDAVASTAQMYTGVTTILTETQHKLSQLYASYNDESAAARTFNAKMFRLPDFLTPEATLPILRDLALQTHRERLDEQARTIMTSADQEIAAAKTSLVPIPAMGTIEPGGVYKPITDQRGGQGGSSHNGSYLPQPSFSPPPASNLGSGLASSSDADPTLAGGNDALSRSTPTTPQIPTSTNSPLPAIPSPNWLSRPPPTSITRTGIIGEPPLGRPAAPRLGAPSNGIIGGEAIPGTAARVTPGMTAGQHNTSAPGVTTRSGGGPRIVGVSEAGAASRTAPGGWQDRSFAEYAERRSGTRPRRVDGDQGWHVEEGVAPVIKASETVYVHDPGAGVIGLDR